ncbi:hypothetical protein [Streptomyces sp. NPDC006552]|uniref:hypothetical protein n=1 Tax=Streptomyces sp. NPDC006552 TaxID=3157179 RepID=UPI00339DDC5B
MPATDDSTSEEDTPATDETTDGPATLSLTDTGTSQDGFEIGLSHFTRAVTGPDDIPENTPYVKFTVHVKNGTNSAVDLPSELTISCSSGHSPGEEVYADGTHHGSGFTTSVLPGRTADAVYGCTLPSGEKYLQVEITPTFDMETVIFSGNVPE